MSLYALLKRPGPSGFGYGSTASEVTEGLDLRGKTYLLTGCNSGLGKESLRVLALRGAHLLAAARTEAKARRALAETGASGTPVACELSAPASVRACVAAVRELGHPLDGIICNAGIMALPRPAREAGYELQFFTNHVAHFMLVTNLLEQLAGDGRVVVVSSDAHRRAPAEGIRFDDLAARKQYSPWRSYGQSKLANILFARKLAQKLRGTGQTANSLHPGVIQTNLDRHMSAAARAGFAVARPLFLKTIPQGAATQCYVAAHPQLAGVSGEYFEDCNVATPSQQARDDRLADQLWTATEEIVSRLQ
jgi:WW domain-containing oxidoreductase